MKRKIFEDMIAKMCENCELVKVKDPFSKSPNIYENGKNEIFDTYTKFVEKSKQNGKF